MPAPIRACRAQPTIADCGVCLLDGFFDVSPLTQHSWFCSPPSSSCQGYPEGNYLTCAFIGIQ